MSSPPFHRSNHSRSAYLSFSPSSSPSPFPSSSVVHRRRLNNWCTYEAGMRRRSVNGNTCNRLPGHFQPFFHPRCRVSLASMLVIANVYRLSKRSPSCFKRLSRPISVSNARNQRLSLSSLDPSLPRHLPNLSVEEIIDS